MDTVSFRVVYAIIMYNIRGKYGAINCWCAILE